MGGVGPSRILSYPEAESRLGDERVQGIDNAFRRVVSARRATTLDQTTFRTTVLAAFPGIVCCAPRSGPGATPAQATA